MIIAVDFDGTLACNNYHQWVATCGPDSGQIPPIGREVPGAFEWLRKFHAAGAQLILWTVRCDEPDFGTGGTLTAAIEYCRERGVEFDGVNELPGQLEWSWSKKAFANVYIDDRGVGCPTVPNPDGGLPYVDWDVVGPLVMARIERGECL